MEYRESMIVEQLKQGNEEAFRYLYDYHYAILCHVARLYVKDPFVAETLVGDTIFHLWEIHETLDISVSLRSYLQVAVRNRCINYFRSKREQCEITFSSFLQDEIDQHTLDLAHPLGILLDRELENEISRAIELLPNECRRVFKKSRFEGKSYEEIAQDLTISVNTVKYHIKNALASLHDNLKYYFAIEG